VSCKLGTLNESELSELREAFKIASVQRDEFIPLDWMETVSPTKFLINGKIERFNWSVDN
jgi:hypothetical protein